MNTTTNQPNSILNRLMSDMDEMQIKRHPLQPHGIVNLQDDEKRLYSTFLVTLLIDQPISTAQSRLLIMLLDSMNLSIQLPDLYAGIEEINRTQLQSFLKLADDKGFKSAFLMDALVLCRLDKSLTENQAKSLAEFVNLLSIDDAMLADVVHLSNKVLSYQENTTNTVAEAFKERTSLTINFDYYLLSHWHEFAYQVLESDLLDKKLVGGSWILTSLIELNNKVEIEDAIINFSKTGKIKILNNEIIISRSYLSGSMIEINHSHIMLSDSNFINCYFNLISSNTSISNSYFDNSLKSRLTTDAMFEIDISNELNQSDYQISILDSEFISHNQVIILNKYNHRNSKIKFILDSSKFKGDLLKTTKSIDLNCNNVSVTDIKNIGFHIYEVEGCNYGEFRLDFVNCIFESNEKIELHQWDKFTKIKKAIYMPRNYLLKRYEKGADHLRLLRTNFKNCAVYFRFDHSSGSCDFPYYRPIENCKLENSPVFCNSNDENRVFLNCDFKNLGNSNINLIGLSKNE